MRGEQEMYDLILGYAKNDERVLAVYYERFPDEPKRRQRQISGL